MSNTRTNTNERTAHSNYAGDYVMLRDIEETCDMCHVAMYEHRQTGDDCYVCPTGPNASEVFEARIQQTRRDYVAQMNARSERCILWVGAHCFVERQIMSDAWIGDEDDTMYFVYDEARVFMYEATTSIASALAEAARVERMIERNSHSVLELDWFGDMADS